MTAPAAPAGECCTRCGERLYEDGAFCEGCGLAVPARSKGSGEGAQAAAGFPAEQEAQAPVAGPIRPGTCACAGTYVDGWCDRCGARQPAEADHVVEVVSARCAGVSDRGVRHESNEDAVAVAPASRGIVVSVADGVSSAPRSAQAAQAAVRAAVSAAVLGTLDDKTLDAETLDAETLDAGEGSTWPARLDRATIAAAQAAADVANAVVAEAAAEARAVANPPSCTFVVAAVEDHRVWCRWVGDSRVYFVPDAQPAIQISRDHSWAQEMLAQGADPGAVYSDKRAHMITAWLGSDAPALPEGSAQLALDSPGWVLAASDGLWNYATDPVHLGELVAAAGDGSAEQLAEALVAFAIAQGGSDNVTVAAVRVERASPQAGTTPTQSRDGAGHLGTNPTTEVPAVDTAGETAPPGDPHGEVHR